MQSKTLIVYDSFFGNTEQVAKAIGQVISAGSEVQIVRVGEFTPEQLRGIKQLIVGSPTRQFRPTKAISDLLNNLPEGSLQGVEVAAFDTRISTRDVNSRILNVMVKFFGYAAKPIADKLVAKGGILDLPPEGFFVKDNEGPLKEGELQRVAEWAKGHKERPAD